MSGPGSIGGPNLNPVGVLGNSQGGTSHDLTANQEFGKFSAGVRENLMSDAAEAKRDLREFAADALDFLDNVGDAVKWAGENIGRPIAQLLGLFPQTAPFAPMVSSGIELMLAMEQELDKLLPDGDAIRKDLSKEVNAGIAEAASGVEEAARKSADPQQATAQIGASSGMSEALQALLASGDLEGVIMAVMSTRAERLTEAVQAKFKVMDANNAKLKELNMKAADLQGKVAADSKNEAATKELGQVNAEITQLSNTMQKEQIELNSLMQKLTQTYEALSNLMKKLGDNMSALVRNI